MSMLRFPDEATLNAFLKKSKVRIVEPLARPPAHKVQTKAPTPEAPAITQPPEPKVAVIGAKEIKQAIDGMPKPKKIRAPNDYAGVLIRQMLREKLPPAEREYEFAKDINRKWRLDIAYPNMKLAIEIEGMAHRTRERFLADIEKYNELVVTRGWRLLRIYTRWICNERTESSKAIDLVKAAVAKHRPQHDA